MPISIRLRQLIFYVKWDDGESPVVAVGIIPESAYWRLCRARHKRHTCATLLLAAGENPKVVSERLGHSSIVLTLDCYAHVLPTMQENATRRLASLLG